MSVISYISLSYFGFSFNLNIARANLTEEGIIDLYSDSLDTSVRIHQQFIFCEPR